MGLLFCYSSVATGRFLPSMLSEGALCGSSETQSSGQGIRIKGLLLCTAGENWTGLWMDSSEENLSLVLGPWCDWSWTGSWIGDYAVLPSVPDGTSLLFGLMAFNWYLSVLSPVCFLCQLHKDFEAYALSKLSVFWVWFFCPACFSSVPVSYTIRNYPAMAVGKACCTVIVRIISLVVE